MGEPDLGTPTIAFEVEPDYRVEAIGPVGRTPCLHDALPAQYLVALAGRVIREIGQLADREGESDKVLSTLSIDTEIRFSSPSDRAAFADDLASAVSDLVSRHHSTRGDDGRRYRLIVATHPHPDQAKRGPS